MKRSVAGETKVLGENLRRRHFVHHKSHLPDSGSNPGRRRGKPATNRFSYGAASSRSVNKSNRPMQTRYIGHANPLYVIS
jgi:hypothetical protein